MSLDISYQGLPIARQTSGRFEDGGLFVASEAPMPVATGLLLALGEQTLSGKVRRVREGSGAGMLIVSADGTKFPRWLMSLHPETAAAASEMFEAEPPPPPPPVVEAPAAAASVEPAVDAAPSAHTPDGDGDAAAGGADDEDDAKAASKPSDGKKPGSGKKGGKKPRKR